ncbi:Lrp/AsnC family transcriptional regulator [Legionella waltersii]|uniref:AsnC family transporter transcription regulator protein n=1 Tax=Legionella waltersii TaxID=66969 RepID=A0A0W1A739_9GAMM|nr:Lrp/AsnC family transcriptional regulator [Legionella waltersii]KTD77182.1 AsnC family transporter transcription regulator protein [Legionella waltersii]SNV11325.1 AsnC family transcription regulator protein [Legionella waltersii]
MKNKSIKTQQNHPELTEAHLDRTDRKILNILQQDNQITNLALANRVGISAPPCFRRVKRLREEGYISKDVALVDPFKVGRPLIVFVNITLEKQREDLLAHFERKMADEPEIMQCYFVSGDTDYLLIIHVADMNHYNELARRVFANEPNIKQFRSSFCLSRTKYNTQVVLTEE